jgi:ParB-like chromosome segregation protein Spo0J
MIKLSKIKNNPNNPRLIKDDKFKKLCESIKALPKMMELRPIVVDDNFVVQGGNMRLKALNELGYKEIPETWVKEAKDFSEDELKEFIIKDNVGFGEWDWDDLANNWDTEKLEEWGLDIPIFKNSDDELNDLSDTINNLYRIEIICKDEHEQENTYNKLIEQGYECRLLTL